MIAAPTAGYGQPRVTADQIRETRCESTESDLPGSSRVRVDDLCGGQPGTVGYLGKIGTVVDDVDRDGLLRRAVATMSGATCKVRRRRRIAL